MAAGPIVGYFMGSWLDGWLATDPYLMITFSVLGLVSSIRETIKLIQRLNQISEDEKDADDF
jgi:F0F1-type ATP synthase assembly protein I